MAVLPGKVLVTGAEGFIGHALCSHLAQHGIDHVGAVRSHPVGAVTNNDRVALGDFAAAEWDAVLAGVDVVVHLAGRAHVLRERAADPTPYIVANVHVTRRLLEAAVRAGVRRVVYTSTIKVYGESTPRGRPFRVGDAPHPSGAYALSKAAAENVLWEVARVSGIESVVLRLPLVYGPGVKGNFLKLLEAIAGKRRLPLAGVANRRTLLYVGNAVSAIEAALSAPAPAAEAMPLADGESVSTPELIAKLAHAIGVSTPQYKVPTLALRAGAMLTGRRGAAQRLLGSLEVDSARFRELARWSPPATVDEGLAATGAWWRLQHAL
ncbi:MAG: NAD-dependent epimerase/dehydratase family protein [Casimicrobiaceae bacterium]